MEDHDSNTPPPPRWTLGLEPGKFPLLIVGGLLTIFGLAYMTRDVWLADQATSESLAFWCSREGPWSSCNVDEDLCRRYHDDCSQRGFAYCFPARLELSDPPRTQAICSASLSECEAWHEDRRHVVNSPLGPCERTTPRGAARMGQ